MTGGNSEVPARADGGTLEFLTPHCPMCGAYVSGGSPYFYCSHCMASWNRDGSFRHWDSRETQCTDQAWNSWSNTAYRCVLHASHAEEDGNQFHKNPKVAPWRRGSLSPSKWAKPE